MIGPLPPGARGFDCNVAVSQAVAEKFVAAGYQFAVRYVRRADYHDYDVTPRELVGLFRAGLAVMLVQHVASPGWHPTGALGRQYGETAADEAGHAGASIGSTLWCDLEEVAAGTDHRDVIAYCNNWFDAVKRAGFDPGLYVGYRCGLTPRELYFNLKFSRYWAAYNLSTYDEPEVRGVQMRQRVAAPTDRVPGVSWEFDVNVIQRDALGGTPALMLPPALV